MRGSILVTGADGFVGHHLCRALAAGGHRVVGLVHRHRSRLDAVAAEAARAGAGPIAVVAADLLAPHTLGPAFAAGVDAVAHLAAEPPGDGPRAGVNTVGTSHLLAAAAAHGVGRVVYTSTISVYDFLDPHLALPVTEADAPAPRDTYGTEKLTAEALCLRAAIAGGPAAVVLRLAGVFGPGKDAGAVHAFLEAARRGGQVHIPANRRVDLLWVEDAVDAVLQALGPGAPPGVYHVGSGTAVALDEVARLAAAAVGAAPRIQVDGPGNAFCLDIARARRVLGFAPTPLPVALERFAAHLGALEAVA